jgi:hypothetical protein
VLYCALIYPNSSRHDHGKNSGSTAYLVKEEKLALDLLEQIKNGADFGKLAKKHSILSVRQTRRRFR